VAFVFVLGVTAFKQGYEDWLKHKTDDKINSIPITIVKNNGETIVSVYNLHARVLKALQTK